jgi:hypothetical protein
MHTVCAADTQTDIHIHTPTLMMVSAVLSCCASCRAAASCCADSWLPCASCNADNWDLSSASSALSGARLSWRATSAPCAASVRALRMRPARRGSEGVCLCPARQQHSASTRCWPSNLSSPGKACLKAVVVLLLLLPQLLRLAVRL